MMRQQLNVYYNLFLILEKKQDNKNANIVKNQMLKLIPLAEKEVGCGLLFEGINY